MQLHSNTVLVTGGASGIGLALAERLATAGSDIIICGRRAAKLAEVKAKLPRVSVYECDLANADSREALAARVLREHPRLNVLVNNAGVQRYPDLTKGAVEPWSEMASEIAINFEAPVHLATLLIPHLKAQPVGAIVNVTSGLSFVPLVRAPIYSATKAALHSFTLSLRRQLAGSSVRVIELIPPAVNTDLGGPGLHTFGVAIDELMGAMMPALESGETEIAYGFAAESSQASRSELEVIFDRMNRS